ncbi:MAG: RNA 2',3'-cyclic phosphodiesterase [Actinomycetales bacterium]|nr:RNA 2',3'-cyclic phosphodiesterase [Actinomycetales bacterium]
MRLFAAVRPPADVLDHLETALASVRAGTEPGPGRGPLRWTPPADRHVTVAFYGEVPQGRLDEVAQALDAAASQVAPFAASLSGAGLFDGRTLWVGCTGEGWAPLMAAAGDVGVGLGRPADRRSRPHLTIARARQGGGRQGTGRARPGGDRRRPGGPDPAALAHALALYRGPGWTVGEVALVESHLGAGPGGSPRHDVVHVAPLGTGPGALWQDVGRAQD